MTTEIYSKNLTGFESDQDLDCLISEYLNPRKIKNIRWVILLKMKKRGEKERMVECFKEGNNWIRINFNGKKLIKSKEISFEDLIDRTRKTIELPRVLNNIEKLRIVVYGDK